MIFGGSVPSFKNIISVMLSALIGFSTLAFAEGDKVVEVRVQGNRRIESAAILNVIKTHAGDTLLSDSIDADIRAIYKLGHFQDIQALKEDSDKGIVLVYSVQEKPIVRDITFEGNKEISTEKLKEALEFRQNTVFSSKDLAKSVAKIKKMYGDEGYYLAEVQTSVKKSSSSDLSVTIAIVEGEKILIKTIHFDGNKAFSDSKLKGVMETKEKWFFSWLTGAGTYKEEVLKNDVGLLTELYMNNGYVNVKIGEPKIELLLD